MTPDQYVQLLVGANKAGFTPLHHACMSLKIETVKMYIEFIKSSGMNPDQIIGRLVWSKTKFGHTPSAKNTSGSNSNASAINEYLHSMRKEFKAYQQTALMSVEDFIRLLNASGKEQKSIAPSPKSVQCKSKKMGL